MSFYVYILRSVDFSYYVGHTDDLEDRIAQHHSGEIRAYTQNRRPVRLVFVQEFARRDEAIAAERQLKRWSRAKTEALILRNWVRLKRLARTGSRRDTPAAKPFDTCFGRLRANGK